MTRLMTGIALAASLTLVACDGGDKKASDSKGDKDKDKGKGKDAAAEGGKEGGDGAKQADADPKQAEPATPVKLAEISLEDAGLEAKMQAPEGAKVASEFGAFTVKSGESFQLEIHTGAADLAVRKGEIEKNDVNKLQEFLTENETELVYTSKVAGIEHHFVANVEVDGAKYYCEDTKGAQVYTKADIDAMLAACKSLAPT